MCRSCLSATAVTSVRTQRNWRQALWIALAAGGWLFAWLMFYYLGDLLSRIPHEWHGGTGA